MYLETILTLSKKIYSLFGYCKIYERHTLLAQFLIYIGVDEETAAEYACKMEHDFSN